MAPWGHESGRSQFMAPLEAMKYPSWPWCSKVYLDRLQNYIKKKIMKFCRDHPYIYIKKHPHKLSSEMEVGERYGLAMMHQPESLGGTKGLTTMNWKVDLEHLEISKNYETLWRWYSHIKEHLYQIIGQMEIRRRRYGRAKMVPIRPWSRPHGYETSLTAMTCFHLFWMICVTF